MDVATIDLLRDRERGVPRYNEFRRMLRLAPAESFGALTGEGRDDAPQAARIAGLYGDVERVDLMVGLYAEPLLPGFGFSETAFRIFVLMASRRLKSDPFFTDDFRPEVYSPEGMRWIEDASMAAVWDATSRSCAAGCAPCATRSRPGTTRGTDAVTGRAPIRRASPTAPPAGCTPSCSTGARA